MTELGEAIELGANGDTERRDVFPGLVPVGRGCSVYLDGHWWVVNPLSGDVRSSAATQWIPDRRWVGIATGSNDALLLASAAGELFVLDRQGRTVAGELRVPVWPSRRSDIGDCSAIGAGEGWFFSYDFDTSHLTVLADGQRIGEITLASVLGDVDPRRISCVAAHGAFLGVGVQRPGGFRIVTLRLSIDHDGAVANVVESSSANDPR